MASDVMVSSSLLSATQLENRSTAAASNSAGVEQIRTNPQNLTHRNRGMIIRFLAYLIAILAFCSLTGQVYAAATLLPNGEQCFQATTPTSGGLYGPITTLGTITGGSGYASATYTNVPLTGGNGFGARATIVVAGGVVATISITNPGSHFAVNDTLSASAANLGGSGTGFSVPVSGVSTTGTGLIGLLGNLVGGTGGASGVYAGVSLTGGSGMSATANITVSGGVVTLVTILDPGLQYVVGDTLSAVSGSIGNVSGFSVQVESVAINNALAGGNVYFYIPNTTTFKQTWQNSTQTILNTNPVTLDANGCAIIYGTGTYRQVLQDSIGNTVWDQPTTDTSAQQNTFWAGLAGGTPNAITLVDPGFNGTDGSIINFTVLSTNTGSTTINPSSYGNIPVFKDTTSGTESLTGGEFVQGNIASVIYRSVDQSFHILNPVSQIPNFNILGSFWTDITDADGAMNAHINPFRDRVFVDDGALENGAWNNGAGGLSNTRSGTAINGIDWNWAPREASLLAINSWGELAVVGMSVASQAGRSGDPHTPPNYAPIGVAGFGLNNRTANPNTAWGGYFESIRSVGGVGDAFGIEVDTGNTGPVIDIDPYASGLTGAEGHTAGTWNQCGGSAGMAVTYTNCSVAMFVGDNGALWRKGIVFADPGLDGSVGSSGGGVAIEMANNAEFRWLQSANSPVIELWGSVHGITINNPVGGGHVGVTGTAPAISACGSGPSAASGTDHNGIVTEGSGATGCTITFATAFGSTPTCVANVNAAGTPLAVSPSGVDGLFVSFVHSMESGAVLYWHCDGI